MTAEDTAGCFLRILQLIVIVNEDVDSPTAWANRPDRSLLRRAGQRNIRFDSEGAEGA